MAAEAMNLMYGYLYLISPRIHLHKMYELEKGSNNKSYP
jgi:hypothetical protein